LFTSYSLFRPAVADLAANSPSRYGTVWRWTDTEFQFDLFISRDGKVCWLEGMHWFSSEFKLGQLSFV